MIAKKKKCDYIIIENFVSAAATFLVISRRIYLRIQRSVQSRNFNLAYFFCMFSNSPLRVRRFPSFFLIRVFEMGFFFNQNPSVATLEIWPETRVTGASLRKTAGPSVLSSSSSSSSSSPFIWLTVRTGPQDLFVGRTGRLQQPVFGARTNRGETLV